MERKPRPFDDRSAFWAEGNSYVICFTETHYPERIRFRPPERNSDRPWRAPGRMQIKIIYLRAFWSDAESRRGCQSTLGQIPPISGQYFDLPAMENARGNVARQLDTGSISIDVHACIWA